MSGPYSLDMTSKLPAADFPDELERTRRAVAGAVAMAVQLDAARRENAGMRRLLWLAAEMSGGQLAIPLHAQCAFDPGGTLEINIDPASRAIVLTAYKKDG